MKGIEKMKKTTLASILVLTSLLIGVSGVAAHSNHDHSYTGIKWEFTDQTKMNINEKLNKYPNTISFGLSRLENKIMDQYGVKDGRIFDAKVGNKLVRFQRTVSGIKILKHIGTERALNVVSLPVNKVARVIPTSTTEIHVGHNHSHFPYEWVFSEKIQKRIERKIKSGNLNGLVGLSKFERAELNRYGIQTGMTFMSFAMHSGLMNKLTSGGIQIVEVLAPDQVAALPSSFGSSISLKN